MFYKYSSILTTYLIKSFGKEDVEHYIEYVAMTAWFFCGGFLV